MDIGLPSPDDTEAVSPGYAAALMSGSKIIHQYFQGAADIESATQINQHTLFHVASLSKQFTALAILQLKEQGVLQLDSAVEHYWPKFSLKGHGITIRHLLSHTSGIHDQWPLLEWAGWRRNDVVTTDDVLAIISRLQQVQFPPGTQFRYCNTGYTILARLVASLTGMPFHQYVKQHIFVPLGMANSIVAHDPDVIISMRAQAYSFDPHAASYIKDSPQLYVEGPTSVHTSMSDYTRWMAAHMSGSAWRKYIDEMTTSAPPFGLGYFIEGGKASPIAYHTGCDSGFTAVCMYNLANQQSVAIFTNASIENLREIAIDYIGEEVGEKKRQLASPSAASTCTPDQAMNYIGVYQSELGEIRRIIYKDSQLVSVWGKEVEMEQVAANHWESPGEVFLFERSTEQEVDQLVHVSQFGTIRWQKITEAGNAQDTDSHIAPGAYYSAITDSVVWITERSNTRSIILPKQKPMQLHKLTEDLYSAGAVWVRYNKQEAILWLSTPRCLNIAFFLLPPERLAAVG